MNDLKKINDFVKGSAIVHIGTEERDIFALLSELGLMTEKNKRVINTAIMTYKQDACLRMEQQRKICFGSRDFYEEYNYIIYEMEELLGREIAIGEEDIQNILFS